MVQIKAAPLFFACAKSKLSHDTDQISAKILFQKPFFLLDTVFLLLQRQYFKFRDQKPSYNLIVVITIRNYWFLMNMLKPSAY